MNAVVLTVKSSYVASSKYRKPGQHHATGILWKMKVSTTRRIDVSSCLKCLLYGGQLLTYCLLNNGIGSE